MIDKLETQSSYLYSGRLEVYINGTWGTICSDGWTINEANVACRQMGFVRATPEDWSYNDTSSVSNKEMLLGHVNCTGNESHLMDCIHNRFPTCGNKIEVGIRCTRQRIGEINFEQNQMLIKSVAFYTGPYAIPWLGGGREGGCLFFSHLTL